MQRSPRPPVPIIPSDSGAALEKGRSDNDEIVRSDEMLMKVVIEFYRVRQADDAHAVIGRETVDAAGVDDAIEIACQLWRTLNMPQQPDAVTISDSGGNRLYSHRVSAASRFWMKGRRLNIDSDESSSKQEVRAKDVSKGRFMEIVLRSGPARTGYQS